MKYERQILVLSVAAAALAVSLVVGLLTTPAARSTRADRSAALPTFLRERVNTIEMAGGETVLVRTGDGWGVGLSAELSVPARIERVDALLDALAGARVRRLVTTNRTRHAELGFGTPLSVILRDSDGTLLLALETGDAVSGGPGLYARLDDSDRVVEIDGTVGFYLDREAGYWVDRRLMPHGFDASRTVYVAYSRGSDRVVLTKGDLSSSSSQAQWLLETNIIEPTAEVDGAAVLAYVRTVIGMEAELLRRAGGSDPRRATGESAWSIELRSDDGRVALLRGMEGVAPLNAPGTHIVWSSEVGEQYQLQLRSDQTDLLLPAPQRFLRRD